ncbi:transglycosylase domain-containing protein [Luethyella okanaganae]|uniref:Transglycosylase domain-containing protein n=1 Tax=Luethyella okanaganae TaxID=69372 RepID=A0ABW1VB69_9MICO
MSAQNRTASGALGGFLGFLGMSVVAGVLVTAAVTPALAVTGIAANNSISMFENLPGYLEIGDLAEGSNIYATNADGSVVKLASFYDQNRQEVGWDSISQFAKDAAIAGEDPRFYDHGGIDLQGTVRAVLFNAMGREISGGSSITQQYVKNVLIEQNVAKAKTDEEKMAAYDAATEQSPERKLKEMRYAIGLEKEYTKDQILQGYLNIAFFGGRVYGIEAASQYYFRVSAKDLTVEQAAALLAIVNSPTEYRLDQPDNEVNGAADGYAKTKERRNYILDKMLEHKKITPEQHDAAAAAAIAPSINPPSSGCQTAGGSAYFCDYVTWVIKNDPAFGETEEDRIAMLQRGGLEIFTTVDLDVQNASESAINELIPRVDDSVDIGSVAVSVQPGSGRILAMAQNKDYSNDPEVLASGANYSAVNYNTDRDYGGSSGFQPGSTYKVFTLGEWLKEGHSLNESVDGRRRSNWGTFRDSCNGPQSDPSWNPRNDEGGGGGTYTALYSTEQSINTGFVAMAKQLDLCGIRQTAEAFGVHRADFDPLQQGPASILGTNEIAPLSMAEAFAGIAASGTVCKPVAIDRITHKDGSPIVKSDGSALVLPSGECAQKVDTAVTAGMAYAMRRVMTSGTAAPSNNRTNPRVPMIGKTGTSDNNEATWMSGASTKVATVVGVFNVSGHANLRNTFFDAGQAAQIRHQIWPRIMSVANGKYGGGDFPEASSGALKTVTASIPDVRGKSIDEARNLIENAGFGFEDGGQQDSELPAGQVSGTSPAGEAPRGSVVTAYTSNGSLTLLPNVAGMDENAAKATLAGFQVKVKQQPVADPSQNNKVIATDPAAGTPVKVGTQVTVTIGKSPGNG